MSLQLPNLGHGLAALEDGLLVALQPGGAALECFLLVNAFLTFEGGESLELGYEGLQDLVPAGGDLVGGGLEEAHGLPVLLDEEGDLQVHLLDLSVLLLQAGGQLPVLLQGGCQLGLGPGFVLLQGRIGFVLALQLLLQLADLLLGEYQCRGLLGLRGY